MSLILRTATRALIPIILLFSVFIMLRGHNLPGGGFIGGMVAGSAFALHQLSDGVASARRAAPPPHLLIASGLLVALGSGLVGLVVRGRFLAGLWWDLHIPGLGTLAVGTPTIFDVGVYLLVAGMTVKILFHLGEEA